MARGLSRRQIILRTAAAGAAAAAPRGALAQIAGSAAGSPPETLDAARFRTLEAVTGRLIPSDEHGPGAVEAGAARYIDGALGDALAAWARAYAQGLDAVDGYARSSFGGPFATLEPEAQDAIIEALEQDSVEGFESGSAAFFELVLGHTIEGTFSDPYYGGNRDFIGWDLLGYPGLRLAVSPAEQRLEPPVSTTRISAYDIPMFESLDPDSEFDDG